MTYHIKNEDNFLDQLIASMKAHKLWCGRFMPPA